MAHEHPGLWLPTGYSYETESRQADPARIPLERDAQGLDNISSIECSNIWQSPDYYANAEFEDQQSDEVESRHRHHYDPSTLRKLDTLIAQEQVAAHGLEDPQCPRDRSQRQEAIYFAWDHPQHAALAHEQFSATRAESSRPRLQQTPIAPSPGADSAYWSLPDSSHENGPGPATSGYLATQYIETVPRASNKMQSASPPDLAPQAISRTEEPPPAKIAQTDPRDRVRQDAHSKVEKRYRMNINHKIEQLRRILPSDLAPDQNFLPEARSPRRRKSGTELSKRDVLALTINHLEQLEDKVQHLTAQNIALRRKVALMHSFAAEK